MSKIRIKYTIISQEETKEKETTAILEEDKIKYKEDPNTTVIWNLKENTLIRETKEIKLKYPFKEKKETIGELEIKEASINIKLPIKTNKLERKKNNITVDFQVEENPIKYCLEEII